MSISIKAADIVVLAAAAGAVYWLLTRRTAAKYGTRPGSQQTGMLESQDAEFGFWNMAGEYMPGSQPVVRL